jgi:hypothetical protein
LDWFGFIRETVAPAVIVECAFLDNTEDVKTIDTAEERKIIGIAIAKAILKTLSIEWIPPVVEEPKEEKFTESQKEEFYRVSVEFMKWLMERFDG